MPKVTQLASDGSQDFKTKQSVIPESVFLTTIIKVAFYSKRLFTQAQLVECLALDLHSGLDLRVVGLSPALGSTLGIT